MKSKGFTLIELMLAILLSSIVMVGLSIPFVATLRAQTRMSVDSSLQGQVQATKIALQDSIRVARNGTAYISVQTEAVQLKNETTTRAIYVNDARQLIYDKNITLDGDEVVLADETQTFSPIIRYTPDLHVYAQLTVIDSHSGRSVSAEIAASGRNQ
jgi:prepilin-type N-terminal cleavage/methylation domain-containing protein